MLDLLDRAMRLVEAATPGTWRLGFMSDNDDGTNDDVILEGANITAALALADDSLYAHECRKMDRTITHQQLGGALGYSIIGNSGDNWPHYTRRGINNFVPLPSFESLLEEVRQLASLQGKGGEG